MITSRDNPRVKHLHKLTTRKYRKREGKFLLDDVTLIQEAMAAGLRPDELYRSDRYAGPALPDSVPTFDIRHGLLAELSDQPSFAGILAVFPMPPEHAAPTAVRRVVLDNIQDPANLGAILRTAALFGVDSAWLTTGCADPWSLKALRAGRGAQWQLALLREDTTRLADRLRQTGTPVLTADTRSGEPLPGITPPNRWALIMGSEGHGLSDALAACATTRITIPNSGRIESFNVSVAAAIILYHLTT